MVGKYVILSFVNEHFCPQITQSIVSNVRAVQKSENEGGTWEESVSTI